MFKLLTAACLIAISTLGYSQDTTTLEYTEEQMNAVIDSIEASLTYQSGRISIVDGDAYIDIPSDYKWLDSEQASYVLTDLWGNPPSDVMPEGMLVPKNQGVLDSTAAYAIEVSYSDEGYIEDDDAKDIDYDEMLEDLQDDAKAANEYRVENGYGTVELVGWASDPYYDSESKKLHWAKELKFGGEDANTLNYNIRVLGRKGYLNLNAISQMAVYDDVKADVPHVLNAVHFSEGNTYADFTPGVDKVAAYGIGALVAGKVLAKAGILAKAGLLLAKFWKFILIAVLGFGAFIKRMFSGSSNEGDPQQPIT